MAGDEPALNGRLPALAIAGTGKAARFLLRLARAAGAVVTGVWGRNRAAAAALAADFGVPALPDTAGLASAADLVLLAVADDALPGLTARLAQHGAPTWCGRAAAHLSGLLDHSCLGPLEAAGACCGSLHPLMTLHDDCPISGVHFFAQWNRDGFEQVARPLVEASGNRWHRIDAAAKPAYHAAAAMLCQGMAASIEVSRLLFRSAGLENAAFVETLGSLASHLLAARFASAGPKALTGPAVRGDVATLAAHERTLASVDGTGYARALYAAAAELVAKISARRWPVSRKGGVDERRRSAACESIRDAGA